VLIMEQQKNLVHEGKLKCIHTVRHMTENLKRREGLKYLDADGTILLKES